MSARHPYVGARGRPAQVVASRRDRAAQTRSARARAHLEKIRGHKTQRTAASIPMPRLTLAAPIAIVVSLICGVLFGSPLVAAARSWIAGEPIRLEALSVSGAKRLSLAEVGRASALPKGVRVDEIEPAAVEAQLLTHPWISDAAVVRLPASRLLIRITERVAHAVVADGADQWRVVSSDGFPFATASGADIETLPRLRTRATAEAGGTGNEPLAAAIELATRFPAFELPTPTEILVDDGTDAEGFVVQLPDLAPLVILGREDLDERLSNLARLLSAGRGELDGAEAIDLRFAQQAVLRMKPSSQGTAQAATARGSAVLPKPRPTG